MMSPTLPISLSPHVCILPSPDLVQLLADSSLPPLPYILQSFSPLPQVTTRTVALASVPHIAFALRFSELVEIEAACHEDEERRAGRTIDWISARISHRCAKWVEDMEKQGERDTVRTPWWDELKRCAEGDHVPARDETWNHPVAVILAVSTNAANPLQAITALHSRPFELPAWVDSNFLKYTLIIHPENSALSDEEAGALFNAVKKQYGLHSYLLPLSLPNPPPKPIPVPANLPRLPPPPVSDSHVDSFTNGPPLTPFNTMFDASTGATVPINTLRMCDDDIQNTARFTREFLVMSVIPWMEKRVTEWNENYSSTKRLPSRLFSSTRRLFGSPSAAPSPLPSHSVNSSVSSISRSQTLPSNLATPPPLQRRLAEFATILGDIKVAIPVWESLRKEGRGGSDILPLLLSPSPALQLHASYALSTLQHTSPDPPANAQVKALRYAARWEIGLGHPSFLEDSVEGDRWLMWAAGNAEEPPSALLMAHAAFLSARKKARRRAALLYFFAASRLEKHGIKPLTMHFLRAAHRLHGSKMSKELSPSFWESEDMDPSDSPGFAAILSAIEHPLGRLLYTTGDIAGAVRFFLRLLEDSKHVRPASLEGPHQNGEPHTNGSAANSDKVLVEDFRVALSHYQSVSQDKSQVLDLKLPFSFCIPKQTRLRLPRDFMSGSTSLWELRAEDWRLFCRSRGIKSSLSKGGQVHVGEQFWVDLALRNPLDVEVNLTEVTLTVEDPANDESSSKSWVDVDSIDEVVLGPGEFRTIPIAVKASKPSSLRVTSVSYAFLSLLPTVESLGTRGRRLQETAAQRRTRSYAPDVFTKVDVVDGSHKLLADFKEERTFSLYEGEYKPLHLSLNNAGTQPVREVWMVSASDDELWIDDKTLRDDPDSAEPTGFLSSSNSVKSERPRPIPLPDVLEPGEEIEIPVTLHASQTGDQELCLLLVYREDESQAFHSVQIIRSFDVQPMLRYSIDTHPSFNEKNLYFLNVEIESILTSRLVTLKQVTALSPTWNFHLTRDDKIGAIHPLQSSRILLGVDRHPDAAGLQPVVDFVRRNLRNVLRGEPVEAGDPPPVQLFCEHVLSSAPEPAFDDLSKYLVNAGRRHAVARHLAVAHSNIPSSSHHSIFPLYNPTSLDIVLFWEMPSENRHGHITISDDTLGARHADLSDMIDEAENSKAKRSMYAETQRERIEILHAIRESEWNAEMDPLALIVGSEHVLRHDFSSGGCLVPVEFRIRNFSLTNEARYALFLTRAADPNEPTLTYRGRLTWRGVLRPSEMTTVRAKAWVARPGTYEYPWRLASEVLEPNSPPEAPTVRHRYLQTPSSGRTFTITIYDSNVEF